MDAVISDSTTISAEMVKTKHFIEWSIAAGPSKAYSPNILSELTFKDIETEGLVIRLSNIQKLSENASLVIEAAYSQAEVISGTVRDSDYWSDNRQDEFSRSYSDLSSDSDEENYSLSVGLKFPYFYRQLFYVGAGYSYKSMDLTMTDGVQDTPIEYRGMTITGLKSTYDYEFKSFYAAVGTEHLFDWGVIALRFEYHDLEFAAEADWNLRQSFAHPKSFEHSGLGNGKSLELAYTYIVNHNLDLFLSLRKQDYQIKDGYDQTYFSDSSSVVIRLNEVNYSSESLALGIRMRF